MDLIVCVGDHCHLNGSEMVVRTFQGLLSASDLGGKVTVKGSFCLGECSRRGDVVVRLGETFYHVPYEEAEACFREQIEPDIEAQLSRA